MNDYGIKVVNLGTSTESTDPRDLILSSKYSMFKYHSESTVSLTINAGDTDVYGTVSHNLGYIPAFVPYEISGGLQSFVPYMSYIVPPSGLNSWSSAYAGTADVVFHIHYNTPYNKETYYVSDYWDSLYFDDLNFGVGTTGNGAMRFTNINLNKDQSIISANIDAYVGGKGAGTGQLQMKTYGIDEDNTADFTGSDPTARTPTDAVTTQDVIIPPVGESLGINVKSQIEEITTRAGWSNGNALGFRMMDNGSTTNVYFYDYSFASTLNITKSGSTTATFKVIIFKDKIV